MAVRILHADDSAFFRRLVGDVLAEAGFEVLSARDGGEVIDLVGRERLDLLLLDLNLPVVTGGDIIERLQGEDDRPVIVVMSGALDDGAVASDPRVALADGAIGKKFEKEALVGLVRGLLDGRGLA
jgi:CheY-like chemotaxis protein